MKNYTYTNLRPYVRLIQEVEDLTQQEENRLADFFIEFEKEIHERREKQNESRQKSTVYEIMQEKIRTAGIFEIDHREIEADIERRESAKYDVLMGRG